jgi:hypothetical protein
MSVCPVLLSLGHLFFLQEAAAAAAAPAGQSTPTDVADAADGAAGDGTVGDKRTEVSTSNSFMPVAAALSAYVQLCSCPEHACIAESSARTISLANISTSRTAFKTLF